VHLWKFADDADRRRFREAVFADEAFMAFARKLREEKVSGTFSRTLVAAEFGLPRGTAGAPRP
jgi:hypothetical protein